MGILDITLEDNINYYSLGLVRLTCNPPALFWFPFPVGGVLVNCDSLRRLAVVSHLTLRKSCAFVCL